MKDQIQQQIKELLDKFIRFGFQGHVLRILQAIVDIIPDKVEITEEQIKAIETRVLKKVPVVDLPGDVFKKIELEDGTEVIAVDEKFAKDVEYVRKLREENLI